MADSDERARLDARIGKTLRDKWRLDRLIGIGGMAAVYAASHRNGAEAAIKILHAEFARRTDARTRFLREAYIANKVGKGAVRVADDDVDDDGAPYLVMDLLHGEPVDVRARRLGGKFPVAEVLWIAREVLVTLEHAHAQGIIHRDLKPDNLFWTTDDGLKVLDFGVARLRDSNTTETTRTGTVVGTPTFMAPEQAIGSISEIDGRSDLWSLGAIMFRLLTGRHVHPTAQTNALVTAATKRAPPILSVDAMVPSDVARIIDTALQFEREQRYDAPRAMREAIEAIQGPESRDGRFSVRRVSVVLDSSPALGVAAAAAPADEDADDGSGLATGMSHDDSVALQGILSLIGDALSTRLEHGAGHPKTIRKVDVAYRQTVASLGEAHIGLFWNVVPEGFVAREQLVWVPNAQALRSPAQMHAGGVRMVGLLPGITKSEFVEVVRLVGGDLAPFSDYATFLHSSQLPHVVHRIDPTRPGMREHESVSIEPTSAKSVAVMLSALRESEDGALRVTLLSRLERWGEGHESELEEVLLTAGVELAMGLLRVLHVLDTPAAHHAIEKATVGQHSLVRIVALSYVQSGDRLAEELAAILSDLDPGFRFDALVNLEKYRIVAAAPALVRHIHTPAFEQLAIEERRQVLSSLGALAPSDAESIAIQLLESTVGADGRVSESTQDICVELLGSVGETEAAREVLDRLATRRDQRATLRSAALAARSSLDARAHLGIPRGLP